MPPAFTLLPHHTYSRKGLYFLRKNLGKRSKQLSTIYPVYGKIQSAGRGKEPQRQKGSKNNEH